jgi:uncharacterized protein YrrD
MYRITELIGLPVLSLDDGKQIGEVQDLVVDISKAAIRGLLVSAEAWFSEGRGILFGDIFRTGADAIMLRDTSCLQPSTLLTLEGCFRVQELAGKTIYTETGLYLGMLSDIFFQPITGELTGYELSDGLVSDFLFGRKAMPLPQAQIVHPNRLLVPEAMSQLLHSE